MESSVVLNPTNFHRIFLKISSCVFQIRKVWNDVEQNQVVANSSFPIFTGGEGIHTNWGQRLHRRL